MWHARISGATPLMVAAITSLKSRALRALAPHCHAYLIIPSPLYAFDHDVALEYIRQSENSPRGCCLTASDAIVRSRYCVPFSL